MRDVFVDEYLDGREKLLEHKLVNTHAGAFVETLIINKQGKMEKIHWKVMMRASWECFENRVHLRILKKTRQK